MFGRSQFNKTTFNVTAPFLGLYVDIRARYDVSVPRLSARVDLGEVNFRSNIAMESDLLYVRVPFAETAMRSNSASLQSWPRWSRSATSRSRLLHP